MQLIQVDNLKYFLKNLDVDLSDIEVHINYNIDIIYKDDIVVRISNDNGIAVCYDFFDNDHIFDLYEAIERFKECIVELDSGLKMEYIGRTNDIHEYKIGDISVLKVGKNYIVNNKVLNIKQLVEQLAG